MGIFDIFTNDAAKNAASQNAALYQNYGTTANNALSTYGTTADSLFNNAYKTGTNTLTNYGNQALSAVDTGENKAVDAYGNAVDAYTPLSDLATKYGGATSLALDSLGVNGADGTARAQSAFTTSPGYQFAVDEATKAAANRAASLGIAGSGNTLDEIRNRAQGVAAQDYGNWRNSLLGFLPYEASTTAGAASGKAGVYGNEAGLYSNDAAQRASLLTGLGTSLTGLDTNTAAARAGVAQNVAQGQTGVASNVASGLASSNNAEAQAEQNASNTFWNGLFSLGGAAAKGYLGGKVA